MTKEEKGLRHLLDVRYRRTESVRIVEEEDATGRRCGGTAQWLDFTGITFDPSQTRQAMINRWFRDCIERTVGYPILLMEKNVGTGRCTLQFLRQPNCIWETNLRIGSAS